MKNQHGGGWSPLPSRLMTPPTSTVRPPVSTRPQELPFKELDWPNFERLCFRLASKESDIEHCQLYGVAGQDQQGIDIYSRKAFREKYSVYQCKLEKNFIPSKIKAAIDIFLDGTWVDRTERFVLCTQESLEPTDRAEELENQRRILEPKGIALEPWDERQLSLQ